MTWSWPCDVPPIPRGTLFSSHQKYTVARTMEIVVWTQWDSPRTYCRQGRLPLPPASCVPISGRVCGSPRPVLSAMRARVSVSLSCQLRGVSRKQARGVRDSGPSTIPTSDGARTICTLLTDYRINFLVYILPSASAQREQRSGIRRVQHCSERSATLLALSIRIRFILMEGLR